MRHNLYANTPREAPSAKRSIPRGSGSKGSGSTGSGSRRLIEAPDPTDKRYIFLESLARRALDLYKSDPEIRSEIKDKIAIFPVNISIARELNDRDQEKRLTNDLTIYLQTKIKEKR